MTLPCFIPLAPVARGDSEFVPHINKATINNRRALFGLAVLLECGGGHQWSSRVLNDDDLEVE